MKIRLLTALLATASLGGCATYDYAGGSAPGGYYYGRPSVEYYGPYDAGYGGYGYGSYGYGGYGYSPYGYYGGGYYGGYYPYYPYRPHYPRPPRPDDDDNHPPTHGDRPAPWRRPDGRYQDTGQVMIPPRGTPPPAPGQPQVRQDGGRMNAVRGNGGMRVQGGESRPRMAPPSQPRQVERPAPQQRFERAESAPRMGGQRRDRRDEQ